MRNSIEYFCKVAAKTKRAVVDIYMSGWLFVRDFKNEFGEHVIGQPPLHMRFPSHRKYYDLISKFMEVL